MRRIWRHEGGAVMDMQFHEVANIFPLMGDEEYAALRDDIAKNGQLQPVYTYQGKIVDGRNRYRACLDLGIEPTSEEWSGVGSLASFVVSLNLKRRHLTSGQKAAVALEILPMLEDEARARYKATVGRPSNAEKSSQKIDAIIDPARAAEQAAQIVGTNRQYVSDAKRIKEQAPAMFEQVKAGAMTLTDAKREIKEEKREAIREQNRELTKHAPAVANVASGQKYKTMVLDPPWDWGDEGDADQFGRARPTYATMSFEQIKAMPVGELAADNAHVYLWITNRSLPKGFELLEAWGFRYVTCLTWCKPSIGMGNYFRGSTEQVLFGVRGSLPLLRRDVGTWFLAKRGERHSAKPESFYELVESCSPGPWLEMFARNRRGGWDSWGAES